MSIDLSVLSAGFPQWAAVGRFAVLVGPDFVEVADSPGGEIRFYIREREHGVYSLSRAERSEEEVAILWSPDRLDVERYLTMEVGDQLREVRGLGMLDRPWSDDEVANGYRIERISESAFALRDREGALLPSRFAPWGTPKPIVAFSTVATAEVTGLRSSFLDPEGKPLFGLWRGPRR